MTVTVTLTFDQLTSKSIGIIYTPTHVCAKFDEPSASSYLDDFGLFINMLIVTVTLTLERLISKSKGFIYTPRQMSVSNLKKLCQFCVYLSSGQGLVYILTCRRSR